MVAIRVFMKYNFSMDEHVSKKVADFFQQFKSQVYKKGEILIRADDNPAGIFYLTEGAVKLYVISNKGDELVLNIFKPVSFFPMNWAINGTQNIYYYEAMTPVLVRKAPKEQVVAFIRSNPDVLFDLMSRIYRGLDGMLMRMSYLMLGNAHARLITELLIQAKRFGKKGEQQNSFVLHVSEKDLAAQAGMTRETVSREMKVLKEKGLIAFEKNKLTIHDFVTFEEELNNY